MKTLDSQEALLFFNAGEALVGMGTYLNAIPSTQSSDIMDDAQKILDGRYTPERITLFVSELKKYGLLRGAKELEDNYQKLREIAKLPPLVFK